MSIPTLSLHVFSYFSRRTGRAGRHGYAYTFLTPTQVRYAGDIVKALELSGAKVPMEINKLWNEYKESQEAVCQYYKRMCIYIDFGVV